MGRIALKRKVYPFLEITKEMVNDTTQKEIKELAPEISSIELRSGWIMIHTREQHLNLKEGDVLVRESGLKKPLSVLSKSDFELKYKEIIVDK